MKWLALATIILLFLLILIICTKISIFLTYYHHQDNDDLKIEFKIWFGLIKYKINVPLIKVDENSPSIVIKQNTQQSKEVGGPAENETKQFSVHDLLNTMRDAKEILEHVFKLHSIVRKFLKKVTIKKLEWNSLIGLGDAAHTGMIVGAFWAIKGSFIGLLSHYMKLKENPKISIVPHFQQTISQMHIKCIFQFRIGNAILAGIKLIKFWRGGLPKFRTKPLSTLSSEKSKSI